MKTIMIAMLAVSFLAAPAAFASEGEHTITKTFSNDKASVERGCFPSTGNWVNAATQSCPDQGSGGVGLSRTIKVKCDPKEATR